MSDDTVASLGFEVNSKPLDDAKQKLSEVATQADKTGQAVDKFNQTTAKTGDALRGGASAATGYAGPLGAIEGAARRAGLSVAEFQARTAAFRAETARLASSSGAAGTAIGAIAREAAAAAPGMSALSAASKAATAEHVAHTAALTGLRGTFQGLNSVVTSFGGSLGGMTALAGAARLGIVGLAAAASGGVLIALAKIGDEVERTKNRFAGLTGSAESGAKAYDAVKAAAKASGVETSTLAGAFEKAKIGLDAFADKHVIYANTVENAEKANNGLISALGTLGGIMHGNLADAQEEKKALDAVAASFQNTGRLSVEAFRAVQAESPSTALAIANAFGFEKVTEFIKELAKAPITIDEFVQRMARVKPQIDATFDPEKPKTFEQAMRGVTAAWNDTMEQIAKSGGGDLITKALGALKDQIPIEKAALAEMARDFTALGTTIAGFVNQVIIDFGKLGNIAISTAQTVASAVASIASAVASGTSNPGNVPASGNPMGDAGGGGAYYDSGGGTGTGTAIDYGGVGDYLGDIPAFATGTDNAPGGLTRINEHGGEIVNLPSGSQVIPHDISMQMAGAIQGLTTLQGQTGVVSATPDPASMATVKEITDAIDQSTIDISKKVLAGSDNIVNALNKLIGGVSAPTINPSTGLPVSSSGTSSGSSYQTINGARQLINPEGGGGAGISFGKASPQRPPPPQPPIEAKDFFGNPNYDGGLRRGQARPVRRSRSQSTFPSRSAINPRSSVPVNPNYSGNPYYGPLDGTDYGYGGYESGYATVGDGYDYGTSPYNDYGYSDYAGYDTGYTGGDFGVGGSTVGDVASQYMGSGGYDYTSGGFGNDTGAIDYGGGSADYGYFAKGGKFTVGGDGGTDTTRVSFHATKGETVEIKTPDGVTSPTPDSVAMPAVANSPAPAPDPSTSNTASTTTKIVNMYLHPGVQAEQMLRSRAQIARGM